MPGPVPNRPEDLSRERDQNRGDRVPLAQGTLRPVNDVWAPAEHWSDMVQELYLSAAESGQSDFYQKSDWMLWFSLCDDLDYYKKMGKRSGQMLQTIYAAMTDLLVTEGARRKARVILSEPESEQNDAAVLQLADYKSALGVAE
jgi:hypothetical protein